MIKIDIDVDRNNYLDTISKS